MMKLSVEITAQALETMSLDELIKLRDLVNAAIGARHAQQFVRLNSSLQTDAYVSTVKLVRQTLNIHLREAVDLVRAGAMVAITDPNVVTLLVAHGNFLA